MSDEKHREALGLPPDTFSAPEPGEDPREIRQRQVQRLRLLLENRGLLLRCLVWGLALSTLAAFLIPARFESTARLMPPDGQSGAGMALLSAAAGRAGGLGAFAGDLLGMKNSGALFVGVLNSETVQDRLIGRFDLRRVYRVSKVEDARKQLAAHSNISEDRKSGILSITVTDHDPKRAAAIAQAYVTELGRVVAEVSTSSARRERIFLEERLSAVKSDLDSSAKNFSEFASKNTAIDIPAQGRAMVEAAAALQGELIAAQSELEGLKQIYADNNVRVRAAVARIGELQKKLNEIGGAGTPGGMKSGDSLYPSIRKLPLLGVTYADLYRKTKIEETVYELLTQQYELAKVEEAKEIPSVKVLDNALVPTKKSFPPRLLLIALGTCVASLAGCAWLFSRRHWNAMDPEDPGKQFAIEVAATVRTEMTRLAPAGEMLRGMVRKLKRKKSSEAVEEKTLREKAAAEREEPASAEQALSRAAGKGLG